MAAAGTVLGAWLRAVEWLPGRLGWMLLILPLILLIYLGMTVVDVVTDALSPDPFSLVAENAECSTHEEDYFWIRCETVDRRQIERDSRGAVSTYRVTYLDGRSLEIECPPSTWYFRIADEYFEEGECVDRNGLDVAAGAESIPTSKPSPSPTLSPAEELTKACDAVQAIHSAFEEFDNFQGEALGPLLSRGSLSAYEWESWRDRLRRAIRGVDVEVRGIDRLSEVGFVRNGADEVREHLSLAVKNWDESIVIDIPNYPLNQAIIAFEELRQASITADVPCDALGREIPNFGRDPANVRAETEAPALRRMVTDLIDALDAGNQERVMAEAERISNWGNLELAWLADQSDRCPATEYREAVDVAMSSADRLAGLDTLEPELRDAALAISPAALHAAAINLEGLAGGLLDPCH